MSCEVEMLKCMVCHSVKVDFYRKCQCGWQLGVCSACASADAEQLGALRLAAKQHVASCSPTPLAAQVMVAEDVKPDMLLHILSRLGLIEQRLGLAPQVQP